MTRLELFIDELVLVGFASADRHRMADEIERELARMAVGINPSWSGRSGRAPTPPPSDRAVGRGQSVGGQVAEEISAVLAAGPRS